MFDAGIKYVRIGQYEDTSDMTGWDWVEHDKERLSLKPEADAATLCRAGLEDPIGCGPLADGIFRGARVLVISDDPSRPTPVAQFFAPVRTATATLSLYANLFEGRG